MKNKIYKQKKSQAGIEYLFVIAMAFFILFIILIFSFQQNKINIKVSTNLEKRDACLHIANEINNIYNSGPGTTLQTKTYYTLNITTDNVILVHNPKSGEKSDYTCKFFAYIESNGTYTDNIEISNKDNTVYITQK